MSFLPISVLMRDGTHKWIQIKRCCRYPYGSFFKLMFTMWTSKLSLCLLIFGLHHDLNNKEYKIIPPKLFFLTCRILKTLPCLRNAILSARVPSCRLHLHPSQFAPSPHRDRSMGQTSTDWEDMLLWGSSVWGRHTFQLPWNFTAQRQMPIAISMYLSHRAVHIKFRKRSNSMQTLCRCPPYND